MDYFAIGFVLFAALVLGVVLLFRARRDDSAEPANGADGLQRPKSAGGRVEDR